MLRRANSTWSSPYGEILRGLFAVAGGAPELLAELRGPAVGGTAYESAWQSDWHPKKHRCSSEAMSPLSRSATSLLAGSVRLRRRVVIV